MKKILYFILLLPLFTHAQLLAPTSVTTKLSGGTSFNPSSWYYTSGSQYGYWNSLTNTWEQFVTGRQINKFYYPKTHIDSIVNGTIPLTGYVPSTRQIINGYGILGGHSLATDITLSVDSATINAQFIKRTAGLIHLATIAQLQAYTGTVTQIVVDGYVFNYVVSGLTADGGVVITRTSGGYWQRQYDTSRGVNVAWWGTNTAAWNSALTFAGSTGTVNAATNYTYLQTDEILVKSQIINGNNATLQRQVEATVLNTVAITSAGTTITVGSVPSTWKAGDYLQVYIDSTANGCSVANKIASIVGNVVTLTTSVGTGQYNGQTSWAIGTGKVRKVYNQINNAPGLSWSWKIRNLTFDGNSSVTSQNLYWGVNGAIFGRGVGQEVNGCKFINLPNSCIIGHGMTVINNVANNLNNDFFHATTAYNETPTQIPYYVANNKVTNANKFLSAIYSRHSEGVITFSFTSGYGSVVNNWFDGGKDAVLGTFADSTTPDNGGTRFFIFQGNQCFNYGAIIAGFSLGGPTFKPGIVHIAHNTFSNCGVSNPFPGTGALVDKFVWDDNIQTNGTNMYVPLWAHNTTDNIINTYGMGFEQQANANINIDGTINAGGATFTSGQINGNFGINGATSTINSNSNVAGLMYYLTNANANGSGLRIQNGKDANSSFQILNAAGTVATANILGNGDASFGSVTTGAGNFTSVSSSGPVSGTSGTFTSGLINGNFTINGATSTINSTSNTAGLAWFVQNTNPGGSGIRVQPGANANSALQVLDVAGTTVTANILGNGNANFTAVTAPTFSGSLIGNANTATSAINATNATNATLATNSLALSAVDNRAVNPLPQDLVIGARYDFKQNATIGLSDGGTYAGVMYYRKYGATTDMSGGFPNRMAFTDNGNVWVSTATNATTWSAWAKLGYGTVTGVTSANADINVATGTTTPVLTFNRSPAYNWIPATASTYNLGSGALPWNNLYITDPGFSGSGTYKNLVLNTTNNLVEAAAYSAPRLASLVASSFTMGLNSDYLNTSATQYTLTLPTTTGFTTDGTKIITVLATGTGGVIIRVPSGYAMQSGTSFATTTGTGGVTLTQGQKVQIIPTGTNSFYLQPLNGSVTLY